MRKMLMTAAAVLMTAAGATAGQTDQEITDQEIIDELCRRGLQTCAVAPSGQLILVAPGDTGSSSTAGGSGDTGSFSTAGGPGDTGSFSTAGGPGDTGSSWFTENAPPRCTADDGTVEERFEAGTLFEGCFELWTGCANVSVGGRNWVSVEENDFGLTADGIETAIESRLRAARIHTNESGPVALVLRVSLNGSAYMIGLHFFKGALYDRYGFGGSIPAWSHISFGPHIRRASFLMEVIRKKIDEFMNLYLLVNEPACRLR